MRTFSRRLLDWYARQGRKLPWRGLTDPYAIWISEIMLQQTRVETVIPYFRVWMKRFPTIAVLAASSEQDVLSVWEGLGYYSRARNLFKAARLIVEKFDGEFPSDVDQIRKLPGIGRYTAGAIASIAFGLAVPALDGNIRRVLSRVFDVSEPADSNAGMKILWKLADDALPKGHAGDANQALMDLGAMICLAKNPRCLICPLTSLCLASQLGLQDQRPVLRPKTKGPHYAVTAAIIHRGIKVLLAKRPSKGLLGGLWEFPGGKIEPGETLEACLRREIREELGVDLEVGPEFGVYRHAYTHFRITLHAFLCKVRSGEPRAVEAAALAWVSPNELEKYPMGKVDRQIARKLAGDIEI